MEIISYHSSIFLLIYSTIFYMGNPVYISIQNGVQLTVYLLVLFHFFSLHFLLILFCLLTYQWADSLKKKKKKSPAKEEIFFCVCVLFIIFTAKAFIFPTSALLCI